VIGSGKGRRRILSADKRRYTQMIIAKQPRSGVIVPLVAAPVLAQARTCVYLRLSADDLLS
jgi:hypothetical protein